MLYQYQNSQIEVLSKYLYELTTYAISKDRAELILSKFISSDTALTIKKFSKVKKYKDYVLDTSLILIGAPQEFMDRYCLKPCK